MADEQNSVQSTAGDNLYSGDGGYSNAVSEASANLKEYRGPHRARPRFAGTVENLEMRLPPGKEIGRIVSVSTAPNGDIFLLNYSNYGPYIPESDAARLPWIVRLDAEGRYITGWGSETVPEADGESQWPKNPENVEVDSEGNVWVTGWNADDNAILKFTPDGRFLRRYGQRGKTGDDSNTEWFHSPPSVYHDVEGHRLLVADGYWGHRVVSVDADKGKITGIWGAYGKPPASLGSSEGFGSPVHKIARAPDGLIYVCDRTKNRVQEFELTPDGLVYRREVFVAPGNIGMGSASDVVFTPDNKYMLVADMMSMRVWSVDRKSFEVLGWTNAAPETEGDDNIGVNRIPIHRMAMLPNGDILITRGRKGVQILKFLGVK